MDVAAYYPNTRTTLPSHLTLEYWRRAEGGACHMPSDSRPPPKPPAPPAPTHQSHHSHHQMADLHEILLDSDRLCALVEGGLDTEDTPTLERVGRS